MGILVVLLIAAWGFVLAPAVLQSVGVSSPLDSERMFQRTLRALGRRPRQGVLGARSILVPPKSPYPYGAPGAPSERRAPGSLRPSASQRRRRNLTYLALFIIATFLLGLVPSLRFLLVLNLVADVLLIIYLAAAFYFAVTPQRQERGETPAVAPGAEADQFAG